MKLSFALLAFLILTAGVLAISEGDAELAISRGARSISLMKSSGFNIERADSLYQQAVDYFNNEKYREAVLVVNQINRTAETAFRARALLDDVKSQTNSLILRGYDVSEAQEIIEYAEQEFSAGNFAEAEVSANHVLLKLSKASLMRSQFLKNIWLKIIIIVPIVLLVGWMISPVIQKSGKHHKLSKIKMEKEEISKLIQDAESKFYHEAVISKEAFEAMLHNYKIKLADAKRRETQLLKEIGEKFKKKDKDKN